MIIELLASTKQQEASYDHTQTRWRTNPPMLSAVCLSMKEILINVWCCVYEAVYACSSWQVESEVCLLIYQYLVCSVPLAI